LCAFHGGDRRTCLDWGMPSTAELFDLSRVPEPLRTLLDVDAPWEVLPRLDAWLAELAPNGGGGEVHPTAVLEGPVYVAEGARVGPFAYLRGPVYLAAGAEVGHAAFIRGPVALGPGAKVMHASEVKRSLLLGGAKAPHFNYVGDSVVGHDVNLGAGVKLANFKATGEEVKVAGHGIGVRKFGAALGDGVSIGCNAVLAPGTVVGRGTVIYNGAMVRGIVGPNLILKLRQTQEQVEAASRSPQP
jgi:UDP-N-acetylglucosamine diphosphorylase / glucose-1-phosphate thymidylyltransferase / UDP-N-acetylgalactosamine diphosphorylase / glucosamine-1-phosphate N-acetyltransferase / galactosamine-1-phosphate N-acetyltransferase